MAKNYHLVNLLSVVGNVFEKLVNNRLVDHLMKCKLFSVTVTVDLQTVVSVRISRAFNSSGATGGAAFDISKAFNREFQVRFLALFGLVSVINCLDWFSMGGLHNRGRNKVFFFDWSFLVLTKITLQLT